MYTTLHTKDYGFIIGAALVTVHQTFSIMHSTGTLAALGILAAGVVLITWTTLYGDFYPDWDWRFVVGAMVLIGLTLSSSILLNFYTVLRIYLLIAGGGYLMGFALTHTTIGANRMRYRG